MISFLLSTVSFHMYSLKNLDGLEAVVEEVVDLPEKMEWFDFSFNELTTIDDVSHASLFMSALLPQP